YLFHYPHPLSLLSYLFHSRNFFIFRSIIFVPEEKIGQKKKQKKDSRRQRSSGRRRRREEEEEESSLAPTTVAVFKSNLDNYCFLRDLLRPLSLSPSPTPSN
ncbi:hypothetical protein LINGRAHAP2_LOCUS30531, partial [Linum grandiflorum]